MDAARTLDIYLDDELRASAVRGDHNYFKRLRHAFEERGFRVSFQSDSLTERLSAAARPGYALFHMHEPVGERTLTTRRAYFYPFWRIESSGKRWEWEVAQTAFDTADPDPAETRRFTSFWRRRLFGLETLPARRGYVFVPLQGLLGEHRSFQTMSPLAMLEATRAALPGRRIVLSLHPREGYGGGDMEALQDLVAGDPDMELAQGGADALLRSCDMVVTQNSSVALAGFFMHKPAVLFGRIDFHHIACNVEALGVDAALARAEAQASGAAPPPPYDRYMHWFLQEMSINGGHPTAETRILDTVRRRGWEV